MPILLLLACASGEPVPDQAAPATEEAPAEVTPAGEAPLTLDTEQGVVGVTPVHHGTVRIDHGDITVWVDPWSEAPLGDDPAIADVLLLTDIHPDHLDPAAIERVTDDRTVVVAPKAVSEQLDDVDHVLANGQSVEVAGFTVTAVPMYNLTRGPEGGGLFHPKGRGNGYLLARGGKTLYIAGDTACTDEMRALEGVDLALVPMNLPYTMTPEEAAECVAAFRPKVVTPYHYRGSDLDAFEAALQGVEGVTVKRLDLYGGPSHP